MSRNVLQGEVANDDDELGSTERLSEHDNTTPTAIQAHKDAQEDLQLGLPEVSIKEQGEISDDYFGPYEDAGGRDEQSNGTPAATQEEDELSDIQDVGPSTPVGRRALSSSSNSPSIPDDTPSVRDSRLSSPGLPATPLSRKVVLRTASGALQPFERRFESRLSSSPLASPRVASPGFLSPSSRQISLSSQFSPSSSQAGADSDEPPQAPWDVVRWTRLRKLTGQVFTETGKRNFGRPTCLAVSALVAIGTTKGFILGFDYHQTLKIIMGPGTRAAECGSVTAIAISADYSTICSGHQNGFIFTWEVNRPARPFLTIPPVDKAALSQPQHADGHVAGSAILHIGFLGMRHTAIVSADASGMAFSHLASRGLGPVTRAVTTTRLLGRYPRAQPQLEQTKASSVLAFSPLPLGNVEQPTDLLGLTAILTPYLLVIVSTTPTAQTQHKAARPKEVTPHSTLSGCLAWFPSVKIKNAGRASDKEASDIKLAYCWSNILSVLEVHILGDESKDPQKPPSLEFVTRSRWQSEEPIVAVQWLGRSVLGALTISQRLLIIDDASLQVTDSLDLLPRHIYHADLFSRQLRPVVEQLDVEDPTMHGVVADAFYMSLRAYKGRLFILSFSDLAVGTLSNWADRLIALMEAGDHIHAIRLASEYYTGSANNVTIGLPDNDHNRHEMVKERLLAMITASLQYTFARQDDSRQDRAMLAAVCLEACVTCEEIDFLTTTVFEYYEDASDEALFIDCLQPYILDGQITRLPAEIVKSMVSYFISENQAAQLEELLCRLEPQSFDLDEMTIICKQHNLYDALIFMWTQAIKDYVTPLIDLLQLVRLIGTDTDVEELAHNPFYEPAIKIFPYLAFSLTGRVFPRGDLMPDHDAAVARADLYGYVFSGRPIAWPAGSRQIFHTMDSTELEPAFPYLTMLLQFDAASFLSMLNEAFEDTTFNDAEESPVMNGAAGQRRSTIKITRQHIISIMLDVMRQNEFAPEDSIYVDMFVARSLAKYPNQLIFSGTLLSSILQRLCQPPSPLLHEDCQLSVEYLLSAYHPPDTITLLEDLKRARFYKVLKTIYRRQKLFVELLECYFEDPEDKDAVFDQIPFLLSPAGGGTVKQINSAKRILIDHANDLVDIDTIRTARVIASADVDLLQPIANALLNSYQCFIFLRTLFEPNLLRDSPSGIRVNDLDHDQTIAFEERYVQLMCKHEPRHVADYVSLLQSGDLRLAEVLPAMEDSGVVDAEVMLLTRDGSFVVAMSRLVQHLQSLQQTLLSLLHEAYDSPDIAATDEAAEGLLAEIAKYTKVGIWLCQNSSQAVERRVRRRTDLALDIDENNLDLDEHLWLDLIDTLVQLSQKVSQALHYIDEHPSATSTVAIDTASLQDLLRPNVQQAFTTLLVVASESAQGTRPASSHNRGHHSSAQLSFLRVLRAFLQRAAVSAPSLSDLREVLSDIFAAYAFEQEVLTMATVMLDADVFVDIQKATEARQQGWRPRTQVCEGCKRRAWGPGIGEVVWDEYVSLETERTSKKARKAIERGGNEQAKKLERGKGRMSALFTQGMPSPAIAAEPERPKLALVVFACRHVFHRVCLDDAYKNGKTPSVEQYKCPICTDKSSE